MNLKCRWRLKILPNRFVAESLHILILSSCVNVKEILESGVNKEEPSELWLDGTGIEKLPLSLIKHSTKVSLLDLSKCGDLVCIPSSICTMTSLQKLLLKTVLEA